jgi:hypothetical protein
MLVLVETNDLGMALLYVGTFVAMLFVVVELELTRSR